MSDTTTRRGYTVWETAPTKDGAEFLHNFMITTADQTAPLFSVAGDPDADDDEENTGGNGASQVHSLWINSNDGGVWICEDSSEGAADWKELQLAESVGTIASQDDDSVDIGGGEIDGTVIGAKTPSSVETTTLRINSFVYGFYVWGSIQPFIGSPNIGANDNPFGVIYSTTLNAETLQVQDITRSGGTGQIGTALNKFSNVYSTNFDGSTAYFTTSVRAGGYRSSDGTLGKSGSFVDNNGNTVTVKNGLITDLGV
ncbi:MAG: hypothetical protein GF411_03815 [Candidatus Lokiarchaeota archaeon]|nr:hypothetical protein [Candidatus Lokiarchaeota archaeon]